MPQGCFFRLQDNMPASKPWFVTRVRSLQSSLGLLQQENAGHSFKIGAATEAALAGVEDLTIQALGWWHSSAFLQYIRLLQRQLATISRRMVMAAGVRQPTSVS